MKVLRNVSPESFSAGEKVHLKTTDAHRRKYILPFVTQSHPPSPNHKNIQMGNDTSKLTLIITLQRKIIKRYPYNSLTLRAEDFKALANGRSRTSSSTPFNGQPLFVFRPTRRVALSNVELFLGQLIPLTAVIQLSFIR